MKIYLDKNKRITGYEITFYDPEVSEYPDTNLDTGSEHEAVLLTHEQNKFIQDHLAQEARVTDLVYDDGSFIVDKIEIPEAVCGLNLEQTVLVDIQNFVVNSDLKRHLQGDEFSFQELKDIPLNKINPKYLYNSDKMTLEMENEGRIRVGRNKRYFGLFDKDILVAFIFILNLVEFPKIGVLYHNEDYNNGGYIAVFNLIKLLKKEQITHLDLGGLTREESGINVFKKKWGKVVFVKDVLLGSKA